MPTPKRYFRRVILFACASFAAVCFFPQSEAKPRTYDLPEETETLASGPDAEATRVNCTVCHSADYIKTQPPGLGKTFWKAEVNKMITVFGAPIGPEDAAKIADYLGTAY